MMSEKVLLLLGSNEEQDEKPISDVEIQYSEKSWINYKSRPEEKKFRGKWALFQLSLSLCLLTWIVYDTFVSKPISVRIKHILNDMPLIGNQTNFKVKNVQI